MNHKSMYMHAHMNISSKKVEGGSDLLQICPFLQEQNFLFLKFSKCLKTVNKLSSLKKIETPFILVSEITQISNWAQDLITKC